MNAKRISRWNGVGRASVAVAGVCLTGSVASAATTARAADLETEFEAGDGLTAEAGAASEAQAVDASAQIVLGEKVASVWEQTLVSYLERIVARDCDETTKDIANEQEVIAALLGDGQKDAEDAAEVVEPAARAEAVPAEAVDVAEVKDADPDWDLEEAPVVVAEAKPDIDPDWDLEEPAVVVATVDPDWDLEEPAVVVVAVAFSADWDLDEPGGEEAVAAAATETTEDSPQPQGDQNPDWDLEEPSIAAVSAEITKVESADDELDFFP